MTTLKELKMIFIGELIACALILPFAAILDGDIGISFITFVERYVIGYNNGLKVMQMAIFALMMTYIIYVLYKAIKKDVDEIIDYFKKRKTTT